MTFADLKISDRFRFVNHYTGSGIVTKHSAHEYKDYDVLGITPSHDAEVILIEGRDDSFPISEDFMRLAAEFSKLTDVSLKDFILTKILQLTSVQQRLKLYNLYKELFGA